MSHSRCESALRLSTGSLEVPRSYLRLHGYRRAQAVNPRDLSIHSRGCALLFHDHEGVRAVNKCHRTLHRETDLTQRLFHPGVHSREATVNSDPRVVYNHRFPPALTQAVRELHVKLRALSRSSESRAPAPLDFRRSRENMYTCMRPVSAATATGSYKRVKGRSHSVEEQFSTQS